MYRTPTNRRPYHSPLGLGEGLVYDSFSDPPSKCHHQTVDRSWHLHTEPDCDPPPSSSPVPLGVLACLWCSFAPHKQQKDEGAIAPVPGGRFIGMIGLIFV